METNPSGMQTKSSFSFNSLLIEQDFSSKVRKLKWNWLSTMRAIKGAVFPLIHFGTYWFLCRTAQAPVRRRTHTSTHNRGRFCTCLHTFIIKLWFNYSKGATASLRIIFSLQYERKACLWSSPSKYLATGQLYYSSLEEYVEAKLFSNEAKPVKKITAEKENSLGIYEALKLSVNKSNMLQMHLVVLLWRWHWGVCEWT